MKKMLSIIQTLLIFLITSIFCLLFPSLFWIVPASLILGLIPFIYAKKINKKEILKLNIISSVMAAILILVLYFAYLAPMQTTFRQATDMSITNIMSIFNLNDFLLHSLTFLMGLNIPFLIYYVLNRKHKDT